MNLHPLFRPMTCLLFLLLFTPGVGFAANLKGTLVPPPGGSRGLETPHALRLLESPEAPESELEQPWRPHGAFRIAAELGAGTLTGLGLGLVGARIGTSQCPPASPDGVPDECTLYPFLGAWLGSGLGFALGTWWGGSLLGGRGHILHTLGGMALGMAAGGGAFLLARGNINPLSGAAMLLPYALSVVAFEMSSSAQLQPMVSFSPRGGAVFGLAGQF